MSVGIGVMKMRAQPESQTKATESQTSAGGRGSDQGSAGSRRAAQIGRSLTVAARISRQLEIGNRQSLRAFAPTGYSLQSPGLLPFSFGVWAFRVSAFFMVPHHDTTRKNCTRKTKPFEGDA